jgi:4-amino-4-deoxy-L-arabinose transferase-like glycosyltransferase
VKISQRFFTVIFQNLPNLLTSATATIAGMTAKDYQPVTQADVDPGRARGRLARLALGAPEDPAWARPGLWAVLILAGFTYAWDLSRNGDANAFYAAAVLSGTESWKAFFYGSLDSASFITVDKPPFAFWAMGISARIFGFNSWSLLLPQAAEGVAAVAVVYAAVRRSVAGLTGERGAQAAGLIAALAMTLTPINAAIDRDDNPDTMLTLLLALGAWALLESLRSRRPVLMLSLSGLAFGLAFNTKMLEGFIALPALPLVYLIAADGRLLKRIGRMLPAAAVLAVVSLSWMTIVDLIPKSSRPFVGSSANDTVWNLAVGYNGFGRVLGNSRGGGFTGATRTATDHLTTGGTDAAGTLGAHAAGTAGTADAAARGFAGGLGGAGDAAGIGRMFGTTLGGQISWLLPFAILAAVALVILIGRRSRTDLARASVMLWAAWLILEFVVLSFQQGTQHPYYVSAMSPAIAALVGIGTVALFQAGRRSVRWRWVLPALVAITGGWAFVLLRRTPSWNAWLPWVVAAATIVTVVVLLAGWPRRSLLVLAGIAGFVAILAGPAAYAATPLSAAIEGNNPLAGPASGAGGGFGLPAGARAFTDAGRAGGGNGTGGGALGGGADTGRLDRGDGADFTGLGAGGAAGGLAAGGLAAGGLAAGGRGGAVSKELLAYLEAHRDGATWLAAVSGSSTAAGMILETGGLPFMAMGGFTSSDPAPTLSQLRQYIAQGQLHYVLAGGGGGFGGRGGGTSATSQVDSYVKSTCTVVSPSAYGASASTSSTGTAGSTTGTTAASEDLYRCG